MTDYLFSVKKLVDRLNVQPSSASAASSSSRKQTKIKIPICTISDTYISEHLEEVRYRNGSKNVNKGTSNKRKKKRPQTEISDSQTRRQSLYQVIKHNKEKLSGKHGGGHTGSNLNSPATTASNSPVSSPRDNKNRTMFEFNVYHTSDDERRDSDSSASSAYKGRKSPMFEDIHSPAMLSPLYRSLERPRTTNKVNIIRDNSPVYDGSIIPEVDQNSPRMYDTVFQDWESPNHSRKNSDTCRPRVSISKSVPLSPPVSTEERSARQCSNFQLKLDTLRAELLAMRKADQELAKRLLNLYSEIQILKVKNSCMSYSELIDEAMYEAEMADEFPDMCDAPRKFTNKLLTSHGVTSFNIHSRRFSCS